jgi:hypothetical protein
VESDSSGRRALARAPWVEDVGATQAWQGSHLREGEQHSLNQPKTSGQQQDGRAWAAMIHEEQLLLFAERRGVEDGPPDAAAPQKDTRVGGLDLPLGPSKPALSP